MKQLTVVTHSGKFHPDDVFAIAAVGLIFNDLQVIRTRLPEIIEKADMVLDVGGVYDEAKDRFDHHQPGGAGSRSNGIPYASFGLFWKKYGEKLCGSKAVAEYLDRRLVVPIDANDSGVSIARPILTGVSEYTADELVTAFLPTWQEAEERSYDGSFFEVVALVRTLIGREIARAKDLNQAEQLVTEIFKAARDKRIIILDVNYPWREVLDRFPEPLFVIYPEGGEWHATAVRENQNGFKNKKDFPVEWAGKRGTELAAASGVADAVFCHNGLFVAVAKTKEGAIKLAERAINQ